MNTLHVFLIAIIDMNSLVFLYQSPTWWSFESLFWNTRRRFCKIIKFYTIWEPHIGQ
jgi:hypothetical protein